MTLSQKFIYFKYLLKVFVGSLAPQKSEGCVTRTSRFSETCVESPETASLDYDTLLFGLEVEEAQTKDAKVIHQVSLANTSPKDFSGVRHGRNSVGITTGWEALLEQEN